MSMDKLLSPHLVSVLDVSIKAVIALRLVVYGAGLLIRISQMPSMIFLSLADLPTTFLVICFDFA